MLLLGSKTFTIDGITVFSDHADPSQFWYLPAPVVLEKREDGDVQFSLIKYRPAETDAGVKGGGYLMFTAALPADHATEQRLQAEIASVFPDAQDPRLSLVPFDDGTVQCVALNLQGSGGTAAAAALPGTFNAVQTILGARTPSLMGNNDAVFSLTLSQEGATMLEAAFDDQLEPIGVIYQLKYTGVRPALDIKITADLKRAYEAFSVGLTAEAYYVTVGIDATWEKLVQTGAIKVEVTNLAPGDNDNKAAETAALAMFKDNIMATWFTPSLSPTTQAAVDVSAQANTDANANLAASTKAAADAKAASDRAATDTRAAADTAATAARTAADRSTQAAADAKRDADASTRAAAALKAEQDKGAAANAATVATLTAAARTAADTATRSAAAAATAKTAADTAAANVRTTALAAGRAAPAATDPASQAIARAAGTAGSAVAPAASNVANSAKAAAPYGAALRLKYVNQEEQKTVTIEYTRQDAEQRTYAPQGYFGAFLSKVDRSKHVLELDLDDPFYRQLQITATPPKNFDAIGLRSVHVELDYGDPNVPDQHKHAAMTFDTTTMTAQQIAFNKNPADSRQYTYTVDYHFDPQAGWDAEHYDLSLPAVQTEDSDLALNPFEFLTFAEIKLTPGRINWDLVDYIELDLDYTSATGWAPTKHFEFHSDTKAQSWKLLLSGRGSLAYGQRMTHHLKDGTVLPAPRVAMTAPAVVIQDPFFYFNVIVEPLLDPTRTKQAFLDIKYTSADGNYDYETSFTFNATDPMSTQRVRFPILDPKQRSWSYRITIVGVANQITRGAWVATTDQEVFVTDLGGA